MDTLQQTIDAAWERRSELSPASAPADIRDAVTHVDRRARQRPPCASPRSAAARGSRTSG